MDKKNIVWHKGIINRKDREKLNGHRSFVLWFTGLPSSGKSTIAHSFEERLYKMGYHTFVLDGDNIRHGLCSDLGFSEKDRSENIRRIAEVVKLFIEAGIITLSAFVSPYKKDRQYVRSRLGEDFIEVYCNCPVNICEQRDKKGYYKKAKEGLIKEYTGVSAPYEPPEQPEIMLDTHLLSIDECVEKIFEYLKSRNFFEI